MKRVLTLCLIAFSIGAFGAGKGFNEDGISIYRLSRLHDWSPGDPDPAVSITLGVQRCIDELDATSPHYREQKNILHSVERMLLDPEFRQRYWIFLRGITNRHISRSPEAAERGVILEGDNAGLAHFEIMEGFEAWDRENPDLSSTEPKALYSRFDEYLRSLGIVGFGEYANSLVKQHNVAKRGIIPDFLRNIAQSRSGHVYAVCTAVIAGMLVNQYFTPEVPHDRLHEALPKAGAEFDPSGTVEMQKKADAAALKNGADAVKDLAPAHQ